MGNYKFITFSGYFFLALGIFDLFFKISMYGFWELDFLWFCSFTLFVLGIGMILRNEILLNSFLAISLIVQPFWILDYAWLSFFNAPLNGLSSFVFRPGYPLINFLLNARHLYMIPFGLYAVLAVSRKNKGSYFFIPFSTAALLVCTYLFAKKNSNLNCVFKPCIAIMNGLSGFTYFLVFVAAIIILSTADNFIINAILEKFRKNRNKKSREGLSIFVFAILILLSSITLIFGIFRYFAVPNYACVNDECPGCNVTLKCRYVDTTTENLSLEYLIINHNDEDYACDIFMKIEPVNTQYKKIASGSLIKSRAKYTAGQLLPYPVSNSRIYLRADCGKNR